MARGSERLAAWRYDHAATSNTPRPTLTRARRAGMAALRTHRTDTSQWMWLDEPRNVLNNSPRADQLR